MACVKRKTLSLFRHHFFGWNFIRMKWSRLLDKTQSEMQSVQFGDHLHLHALTLIGLHVQMWIEWFFYVQFIRPFKMHTNGIRLIWICVQIYGSFWIRKKSYKINKDKVLHRFLHEHILHEMHFKSVAMCNVYTFILHAWTKYLAIQNHDLWRIPWFSYGIHHFVDTMCFRFLNDTE